MLFDPGTFVEIGALAKMPGAAESGYGDGVVTGHGLVHGRPPVAAFSHDQNVFGGTVGEIFGRKVASLMEWAGKIGCPMVGINDSAGARIQDAVTSLAWYAEMGRRNDLLSGLAPADLGHPRQVCGRCRVHPRQHRHPRRRRGQVVHVRHRP